MKSKFVILLVFSLIFFTTPNKSKAESHYLGVPVDLYAHFGVAYALQTVSYGFFRKDVGISQGDSIAAATFLVFTAAAIWGIAINGNYDAKHLIANSLGQAAAGITIVHFDF